MITKEQVAEWRRLITQYSLMTLIERALTHRDVEQILDAYEAQVKRAEQAEQRLETYEDCFQQLAVKSLAELVEKFEQQLAAKERELAVANEVIRHLCPHMAMLEPNWTAKQKEYAIQRLERKTKGFPIDKTDEWEERRIDGKIRALPVERIEGESK